jgi:ubiquitin carboxyl-terminal hydrolase 14
LYDYCADNLQQHIREQRKEDGNQTGMYELFALVSHKGRSADSGHYMGYTRQQLNREMWWLFNDDVVSEVSTEEVLKLSGGGDRDMAYLLFFRHVV